MNHNKAVFVTLVSVLVLGVSAWANAQAEAKKVDPTGTWRWSFTTPAGETRQTTLVLKLDGDKLSGTISGRRGDTPISDATVKGDEISFIVVREFGENKVTNKYSGKISGDTITGKIEFVDRAGQTQTRDWEAKREPAKPKEQTTP